MSYPIPRVQLRQPTQSQKTSDAIQIVSSDQDSRPGETP